MRRLIAVTMAVALLAGCGGLRGNSRSYRMEQETNYLAQHSVPISIDDTAPTVDIIEKQVHSQNIILTGVVPGVSGNSELQKHLFEAFDQVNKIDYLVAEIPYSAGELLNSYLSDRKEDNLNKVFESLLGRPYASEENRSFYRQLKLYSKSRGHKIRIVGIDLEYEPVLSVEYLSSVLENYELADYPVAAELVSARNKGFMQPDYLRMTLMKFYDELKVDTEKAKAYFGDNYYGMERVLENLEITYAQEEIDGNDQFDHSRSDQIVKNFLTVYDTAPDAVYFGQLASPAIMQSEHMNFDWFASAIQKERGTIEDKIISVLYTYEDCQRMIQLAGKSEIEKLDLFKFDNRNMINAIKQPYTLISLIDKTSMFNEETVIFEKDFSGAVTEYFQYLVVLNESPASKALK